MDNYCKFEKNYLRDCGYKFSAPMMWAAGVFLIGIILRCIAWSNTFVIDPDGALYIHQARAIHYSQWTSITGCGLSYVSNYPIFVSAAYKIFPDWIIAARSVSFIFGVAVLIPLYLLLRHFFDDTVSAITTLIFAVMPMFVGRSVDALRDPTYWFFMVSGLYFFTARMEKENRLFLILSCLSFLIAAWARIEAILFVVISIFYIIYAERSVKKLLIFASPLILIIIVGSLGAIFTGGSISKFHRGGELLSKFSAPFIQYQALRDELKTLASGQQTEVLQLFLSAARSNIWMIALGMLISHVLEAFFYPFFIVFLIGLTDLRQKIREDIRLLYFSALAVSSLMMLYAHIFHKWVMDYRFLAIFIFPCAVFTGFGIEKIISWLQSKFSFKESLAIAILAVLILACTLPKNFKPRDADKLVFKQIGEFIAKQSGNQQIITISASYPIQRWVSFYANLHYKGAVCPEPSDENCWDIFAKDSASLLQGLKEKNIRYFLWTEQRTNKAINIFKSPYQQQLKEIRRWRHPDTGEMILFEVI
jgi:4-amino-4-deoxy-L-arabinose transferase-like glycosyltransferase